MHSWLKNLKTFEAFLFLKPFSLFLHVQLLNSLVRHAHRFESFDSAQEFSKASSEMFCVEMENKKTKQKQTKNISNIHVGLLSRHAVVEVGRHNKVPQCKQDMPWSVTGVSGVSGLFDERGE